MDVRDTVTMYTHSTIDKRDSEGADAAPMRRLAAG